VYSKAEKEQQSRELKQKEARRKYEIERKIEEKTYS